METKDLHKELSRKKLEALVEIQEKIDGLDFKEMLEFLVKKVVEVLEIKRCSIFRIFPDSEIAHLIIGEPAEEHGVGMKFFFEEMGALKEAINCRSRVLIAEPLQDERTKNTKELIHSKGINAILFVPLMTKDQVIGVIVADATDGKKNFNQEEIYFCAILSNLAGLLLERDLLHQQKEEKKALEILGKAAAEAAHRIRNPLASIGGFARRLAKQIQELEYRRYAEIIVRETERMETILNDLLRFSRPKKQNISPVSIEEVIKEAKEIAQNLIKKKKIKIELKLNGGIPFLLIDVADVRDAFLDILRNAIEAIEEEGLISIQTKGEENQVKIFISNTGGCIDEEILEHIFDPFFTTKPDGTGLGLASAVKTLDAYGGELKVENDIEKNQATFILKIPYSQC